MMVLGSIHCATNNVALDAILARFGFRTLRGDSNHSFNVVSMTRRSDPVVERDLFARAMRQLEAARSDGAIPVWQRLS
jgi:hypothetical protein